MAHERFRVLILGYGEMGRAMETLLRSRHETRVWQRRPPADSAPLDLEQAAAASDVVLFCVPTQPHFALAERLRSFLSAETLCLTVAKGLDDAGRPAAQIFQQVLGRAIPFAVLHGPMIAEEIVRARPAFAQVGTATQAVYTRVAQLFAGTTLILEYTADQIGVAWAAVLKNVYAMLFGVADEFELGDNTRGYLAAAVLREMDALVVTLGGRAATAYGLAGLADLITTGTSADSHHHALGRQLARGETRGLTGEGLHTLAAVRKCRLWDSAQYPLYGLLEAGVQAPSRLRAALLDYLHRSHL